MDSKNSFLSKNAENFDVNEFLEHTLFYLFIDEVFLLSVCFLTSAFSVGKLIGLKTESIKRIEYL
jgi:hypothetical protein